MRKMIRDVLLAREYGTENVRSGSRGKDYRFNLNAAFTPLPHIYRQAVLY
jgi:hypothetical protein